ncbi:MAG: holo-ACP synthase [Endomicrobium sp.]|jgi:holo-[acyl-carrier protein] synthase|uniref:holo-ACP synthase n=1 Tax=Candidatus Endomicrobiellum cubanum TaxID=3242325 RepID=UPI00282FF28C|nr:holo-ACP synthase [Endomicrobium sp.]
MLGVDIEEVKRFNKYLKNLNIIKRIFSQEEIDYSFSKKNVAQHLAVRFAAKEAVWKALSGSNKKVAITDIKVINDKYGKPEVFIKDKKTAKINLSISHTNKYAVAVAIFL